MLIVLVVILTFVTGYMTYTQLVIAGFTIIFLAFIIFVKTTGIHDEKVKVGFDEIEIDTVVKEEDDKHWIAGVIYYNNKDPAILVPKRLGLGHTLIFGNPISFVMLLIIIAVIVVSIVLSN